MQSLLLAVPAHRGEEKKWPRHELHQGPSTTRAMHSLVLYSLRATRLNVPAKFASSSLGIPRTLLRLEPPLRLSCSFCLKRAQLTTCHDEGNHGQAL